MYSFSPIHSQKSPSIPFANNFSAENPANSPDRNPCPSVVEDREEAKIPEDGHESLAVSLAKKSLIVNEGHQSFSVAGKEQAVAQLSSSVLSQLSQSAGSLSITVSVRPEYALALRANCNQNNQISECNLSCLVLALLINLQSVQSQEEFRAHEIDFLEKQKLYSKVASLIDWQETAAMERIRAMLGQIKQIFDQKFGQYGSGIERKPALSSDEIIQFLNQEEVPESFSLADSLFSLNLENSRLLELLEETSMDHNRSFISGDEFYIRVASLLARLHPGNHPYVEDMSELKSQMSNEAKKMKGLLKTYEEMWGPSSNIETAENGLRAVDERLINAPFWKM